MPFAPGIHLVHKPVGVTSFQVVKDALAAQTRRKVPMCHGGTLDPFAEGLLLLLVGAATKLMNDLHDVPKRYRAKVQWGVETDNGDPTGKVIAEAATGALTPAGIDATAHTFLGWTEQVPPLTSNKRVDGERAYEKAHRGEVFELPASRVFLHEVRFIEHALPASSVVELSCRGGFYVRSFVRDLGRALGTRAHVVSLQRTAIGPWRDDMAPRALSAHELLPWLRSRLLTDQELGALRTEEAIPRGAVRAPEWPLPADFPGASELIRAFHREKLVGIVKDEGATLAVRNLLPYGI